LEFWNFGSPAGKIPKFHEEIVKFLGCLEFWNFGRLAWEISKFHWKFNNSREPGISKARLGKSKILRGNSKLSQLEFIRNSRSWSQRRKPCSYVCWDSGRVFNPSGDATTRH